MILKVQKWSPNHRKDLQTTYDLQSTDIISKVQVESSDQVKIESSKVQIDRISKVQKESQKYKKNLQSTKRISKVQKEKQYIKNKITTPHVTPLGF